MAENKFETVLGTHTADLAPEQPTHKCESLHQDRFSCWGTGDTYFLVDWATKQEVGPPNYSPPSVVVSPFGQVTRTILERPIQEQLAASTEPTSPLTPLTLQGFVTKIHRADATAAGLVTPKLNSEQGD